jgi:hypothetical protein
MGVSDVVLCHVLGASVYCTGECWELTATAAETCTVLLVLYHLIKPVRSVELTVSLFINSIHFTY